LHAQVVLRPTLPRHARWTHQPSARHWPVQRDVASVPQPQPPHQDQL